MDLLQIFKSDIILARTLFLRPEKSALFISPYQSLPDRVKWAVWSRTKAFGVGSLGAVRWEC